MSWPDVESLLPHRAPMRFVDRVVSRDGARLVAEAAPVPFGAYPGLPAFVMVEGLAQALACLAELERRENPGEPNEMAVLTGVARARFERVPWPVIARYEVEVTDRRFGIAWARGTCFADGVLAAEVDLRAALVAGLR